MPPFFLDTVSGGLSIQSSMRLRPFPVAYSGGKGERGSILPALTRIGVAIAWGEDCLLHPLFLLFLFPP